MHCGFWRFFAGATSRQATTQIVVAVMCSGRDGYKLESVAGLRENGMGIVGKRQIMSSLGVGEKA